MRQHWESSQLAALPSSHVRDAMQMWPRQSLALPRPAKPGSELGPSLSSSCTGTFKEARLGLRLGHSDLGRCSEGHDGPAGGEVSEASRESCEQASPSALEGRGEGGSHGLLQGEFLLEGPSVLLEESHLRKRNEKKRSFLNIGRKVKLRNESKVESGEKKRGGVVEQLMSGAFAGVISRTAVAPIDLVKTHLITAHGSAHARKTATDICATILKRDGWRGLFRGNGINCIRVAPCKAIELCVFETLKRTLCVEGHPLQQFAAPLSGGAAGMAGTIATYPLELVRTRISVQPHLYRGLRATVDKILKEEGAGALYRGLTPSLLGVFPYAATNYFVYDALRGAYRRATGEENVPPLPTLAFGAIAAAASSAATFPLEVARRQLQLGGHGVQLSPMGIISNIYKQEGFLAIYRGLGTTWLKLVPAAGISFVCYEAARVALRVDDASYANARREKLERRKRAALLERAVAVRDGRLMVGREEREALEEALAGLAMGDEV